MQCDLPNISRTRSFYRTYVELELGRIYAELSEKSTESVQCQGHAQKFVEGGAKITFCRFHGAVAVKTSFFWRSIFSMLYQATCLLPLLA